MPFKPAPPASALAKRADDIDPDVRARVWQGWNMLGHRNPTLPELRRAAEREAKLGMDPKDVLEVGLLLPEPQFDQLVKYVQGLTVAPRSTRRRRR